MPDQPKVSILIPTYNYARFLPEAIESVLRQDFSDFELIVSDDCSTDDSARILRDYASRDPRIRVHIHRPNLGMVANWNWCLQQARGQYVRFLFGDDCLAHPSALSRLVALLDANPSASLAVSARFTTDEESSPTGIWDELKTGGLLPGTSTIARCLHENRNLIGEPSAVMFRRELGLRGFDPDLKQIVDLEMWFHLLLQGDAVYTPEPLCCFRQHGAQQTAVNRLSQAGDFEMVGILREYLPLLAKRQPRPLGARARRRILYRALVHLLKKDSPHPALADEAAWVRSQISAPARLFCLLVYRLQRPLENFRRSSRKRSLRQKIRTTFTEHVAFVHSLRTPAGRFAPADCERQ